MPFNILLSLDTQIFDLPLAFPDAPPEPESQLDESRPHQLNP
jgi:hypothetical protein